MSSVAPTPHRLHLPSARRLAQLGFLAGVAAGALAYLAGNRHEAAFVAFGAVWYVVGYGLTRAVAHPEHRREWVAYIALFPVVWAAVAAVCWLAWGSAFGAVVLGLVAAVALQALAAQVVLRQIPADQKRDLRRRMGLE